MLCLRHQQLCRVGAYGLILILLNFGITPLSAATAKNPSLATRIEQRFNDYRTSYPEIEFVLLRSMSDLQALIPFTQQLGPQARNIDYAHPADLREVLIETQQHRITHLLVNRQPSATLFEVGTTARWGKPFLCLIGYDETVFLGDSRAATRFMVDLSELDIQGMPDGQLLDNTQFALYTLDHELFHCLDGYHNGPMYPMTMSDIKSLYDQHLVEIRAEIFASFAHLLRNPNQASLLHNLARIRILSLANWDPTHYTAPILRRLANLPTAAIPDVGLSELAQVSTRYAQSWSPDLNGYKTFLITAYHLARNMGVPMDSIPPELHSFSMLKPDETAYQKLIDELNHAIDRSKQATP